MLRNVYLDGELGEKYGKELQISASSISDVFKCLEANFSDFRQYLLDCHEKNIGFICEVQGRPLESEKELLLQFQEGDMYISPQPAGSKSGAAKIFAAIVVALLIFTPGGQAILGSLNMGFATTTTAGGLTVKGGIALSFTASLGLAGVQQMMMPDPSIDAEQDESYLFQGSGQTLVEGDPVPVLYGELRIPGRPISMIIRNQNGYFYNSSRTISGFTSGYGSNNTSITYTGGTPDGAGAFNPGTNTGGGGSAGSGNFLDGTLINHE